MKHLALLAIVVFSTAAFAQTSDDEPLPGATQAIQERYYKMGLEVGAGGGLLPADVYTKHAYVGGSVVIHFGDVIAWQVARGGYGFNWSSALRQQLERDFNVLSTAFNNLLFFVGSQLLITPFYGKSAVANKFVIHYEAYIEVGGGVYAYKPFKLRPGIDIGGGLRVFQNRVLSYRLEVLDSILVVGGIANVVSVNLMVCLNVGFGD